MIERELFRSALEIEDLEARRAHVEAACGDDPELFVRVQALLASHDDQSRFLRSPVVEQLAGGPSDPMDATVAYDFSDGSLCALLEPTNREDSLGRLGHYEILEFVGQGAFGTVLKAFDERLQRIVAIKVLAPELASTSPARKRFLREARASAAIRHEYVVAIHAVEDEPTPYIVMEFVPGRTLQERLDEQGPLDVPRVLLLGKQIAEGLAAAHAQGLVHRDVKPGNILLETCVADRIKLTDFGLARTVDDASVTQSGFITGTPMYMAPEQALGRELDQRADLFSLGSVLYQMLSGRPPFRAPTTLAVMKRVTEDTPRPIREIIPEVPAWMSEIVGHLHAKDPNDRYSSAQEVAELLGRSLTDLEAGRTPRIPAPTRSHETPIAHPTSKSSTRDGRTRSRSFATIAVLLLLLVSGLGLTEATGVTKLRTTVLRLVTGSGTLVIETDDPNIVVSLEGEEITIRGAGVKELNVRPGEHVVTTTKDGKPVGRELVTIDRGGRTVLKLTMEPTAEPGIPAPEPFAVPESRDPDVRQIAALPAEQQVEEVRRELKRRNPRFDEESFEAVIEGGVVVELKFLSDYVSDITPVRALTGLQSLDCSGTWTDVYYFKSDASPFADLSPLQGLRLVRLECNGTEVADISPLRGMPLEHVSFAVTPVADLSPLDSRRLKTLHVPRTAVTDTDLAHFDGCTNVTSLVLAHNRVGNEGVARFAGCTGLTKLNLSGTEIGNEVLALFQDCTGLKSLGLSNTTVSNKGLEAFKRCDDLTELYLGETNADILGLAFFHGHTWTALDLSGTKIDDAALKFFFEDCRNLRWLSLGKTAITDAGFAHFEDCRKLDVLVLSGSKVGDAGIAHFKNCRELKVLDLQRTNVTSAGMVHFRDCRQLKYLGLANTRVGDEGLACFRDCEELRWVQLTTNHAITDAGLAYLARCRKLSRIDLAWTRTGDAGLAHLAGCENLRFVGLTKDARYSNPAQVTNAGLKRLVGNSRNLRDLRLTGTGVTDFSPLRELPLVETLHFDFQPDRDTVVLRSIETLDTINGKPAAEFWSNVDRFGRFETGEWIDVGPLVDPELDKQEVVFGGERMTGVNDWRVENGELVVGDADDKFHKLLLPLDSHWSAFECELELTLVAAGGGFVINIPAKPRDCPLAFGWPEQAGVIIGAVHEKPADTVSEIAVVEAGKRTVLRIEVRRDDEDRLVLWRGKGDDEEKVGDWSGDLAKLSFETNKGYAGDRRLSLGMLAGTRIVFHRIRIRLLDGTTATTIRPVPSPKNDIPPSDSRPTDAGLE